MKKFLILCISLILTLSTSAGCDINDDNNTKDSNINTLHQANTLPNTGMPSENNEKPAKNEEIINSVLSSIEDYFYSDESYTTYNFIDKNIGFFFHFGIRDGQNKLLLLMNTNNGGKSWSNIQIEDAPSTYWKESILCAKMLDENIGFIFGEYYADDNISRRTYITTDSGKHWDMVVLPTHSNYVSPDSSIHETYIASCEAYNLVYENEKYFLCLRERHTESTNYYEYFKYSSTNLKTWTFVE